MTKDETSLSIYVALSSAVAFPVCLEASDVSASLSQSNLLSVSAWEDPLASCTHSQKAAGLAADKATPSPTVLSITLQGIKIVHLHSMNLAIQIKPKDEQSQSFCCNTTLMENESTWHYVGCVSEPLR